MQTSSETMTLEQYKAYKVGLLHSLGFRNVTKETFAKAKSEIAVDNIAHSIIVAI